MKKYLSSLGEKGTLERCVGRKVVLNLEKADSMPKYLKGRAAIELRTATKMMTPVAAVGFLAIR